MVREERRIELTLISAQDVKNVATFGQQACYAIAYISDNKKKTKVDKQGGLNPVWNEKLVLFCDETLMQRSGKHVTVEIYSRGSMHDKLVGYAKVSLVEIAAEGKGSQPRYIAYQLRRPSGKVQGVVNLSIKLGDKRAVATTAEKYGQQLPSAYGAYATEYDSFSRDAQSASYVPQQYPPPAFYQTSNAQGRNAPPAVSAVYPPQQAVVRNETDATRSSAIYPPPQGSSSRGDSGSENSASKEEEPVMAYPASGYGTGYPPSQQGYGQNNGSRYPQVYGTGSSASGTQYPGYQGQQYYPAPQASDPYNYQQAYYSKPARRQGGSGLGLGLLGGALGGLLLGDVIGDAF